MVKPLRRIQGFSDFFKNILSDRPFYFLITLIVIVLFIHIFSLMRFPEPFVDEAWLASRAWGFLQTGKQVGPLDQGVITTFNGHWTLFPLLPTVIQAFSLSQSEIPSLFPIRITSLLFGLLLLLQVFLIAYKIGGRYMAALSVLFTAISRPFFISSHIGRVDIMAALSGFAGIAVYTYGNKNRILPGFLSGLLIGISVEFHPNAVIYILPIALLILYTYRWSFMKAKIFWGLIAGLSVSAIVFFIVHISQFPETFFYLNSILFSPTRKPPILYVWKFEPLATTIQEFITLIARVYLPLFPLVIISFGIAVTRRNNPKISQLLIITTSLSLGFMFLIRNKLLYYSLLITPAFDIIVAAGILWLMKYEWKGKVLDYIRTIFLWGSIIGYLLLNSSVILIDRYKLYIQDQTLINEHITFRSSIIGPQTYWFGLYEHKYFSWEEILYYQRLNPGSSITDALTIIAPDYFILDGHLDYFITDNPQNEIEHELNLPKSEFEEFLNNHGTLIQNINSSIYGKIRVYRLNW